MRYLFLLVLLSCQGCSQLHDSWEELRWPRQPNQPTDCCRVGDIR